MKKSTLSILTFISCGLPALAYAEEKTAADVAGQALNMLSAGVSKISDLVQKTAPEVWRIMIRQQYAEVAVDVGLSALFLSVAIGVFYATKRYLKIEEPKQYGDDNDWKHVCKWWVFAGILVTSIIFVCNVGFGIGKLINPEYYAIKSMLELAQVK
jgi:hypothetical protein